MQYEIHYGKADVKVYRTYGTPLIGITPIPESPFAGRPNTLMAAQIEVNVRGEAFLDAYTVGDNRLVVATDTMKNFIHAASQDCRGHDAGGLAAPRWQPLPGGRIRTWSGSPCSAASCRSPPPWCRPTMAMAGRSRRCCSPAIATTARPRRWSWSATAVAA